VEPQERENMALFASKVRDAFGMALPYKRLDLRFRELMRETVLGTFISCWHLVGLSLLLLSSLAH
jgi:hypothetical protein